MSAQKEGSGQDTGRQNYEQYRNSQRRDYQRILAALRSQQHVFFSPETSPHPPLVAQSSTSTSSEAGLVTIASLQLHPAIESALHIMNCDLTSAHFLLRHAQAPPAWECMYLHGILHRIEGDVDNARAWYNNVQDSEVVSNVWANLQKPGEEKLDSNWHQLLDRVQRWRDRTKRRRQEASAPLQDEDVDWELEEHELRTLSLQEIEHVLSFCENKFGLTPIEDARDAWVEEEERLKEKKQNMLVGGEGWREF